MSDHSLNHAMGMQVASQAIRSALRGPAKQRVAKQRARGRARNKRAKAADRKRAAQGSVRIMPPWEANAQFMDRMRTEGHIALNGYCLTSEAEIEEMWEAEVAHNVGLVDGALTSDELAAEIMDEINSLEVCTTCGLLRIILTGRQECDLCFGSPGKAK